MLLAEIHWSKVSTSYMYTAVACPAVYITY